MQLLWPMVWAGAGMHIFPATWPPTPPTLAWVPGHTRHLSLSEMQRQSPLGLVDKASDL